MQFETSRLTLRLMQPTDLEQALLYWLDASVNQYLPFPLDRSFATQKFNQTLLPWGGEDGDKLVLAIVDKASNGLIGEIMFKYVNKASGLAEIGYCLNVQSQGKGYAAEAVKGLMGFAFSELGAHKLMAIVDTRNLASTKLLDKLAMRREGCLIEHDKIKGQWCDLYSYGMLAKEFNGLYQLD